MPTLSKMKQLELADYIPVTLDKKNKPERNVSNLWLEYNEEFELFNKALHKEQEKKEKVYKELGQEIEKPKEDLEPLTKHEFILEYVANVYEQHGNIRDLTLEDAYILTIRQRKKDIWQGLNSLLGRLKETDIAMLRGNLKDTDENNLYKNEILLKNYNKRVK